jgi:hypothetical protein
MLAAAPPSPALADDMDMAGMYGPYPMSREASGTAWQPDTTPHEGIETMHGAWMTMIHGNVDLVFDHQGGPRGSEKAFSSSGLMLMAQHASDWGTWGLRAMPSADPLMGKSGYPLLFGSGETADGRTPLIDRQHPHNFLMELATTYSVPFGDRASVFGYAGFPGEPALGPPAFVHRFSSQDSPEAPITHHWFDSTHVMFGVATIGAVWRDLKLEVSAFNGHEPDQFRWRFEHGPLVSNSARLSWNPGAEWSLQASQGLLKGPEQLDPALNVRRRTVTAIYQHTIGGTVPWGTTFGWGRNDRSDGVGTGAWIVESAARVTRDLTLFARAERLQNDEYFQAPSPLAGIVQTVGKLSVGAVDDFFRASPIAVGAGGLVSRYAHGAALDPAYGHPTSWMVYLRAKIER